MFYAMNERKKYANSRFYEAQLFANRINERLCFDMYSIKNEIVLLEKYGLYILIGATGTGKTYWINNMCKCYPDKNFKFLILQHQNDYSNEIRNKYAHFQEYSAKNIDFFHLINPYEDERDIDVVFEYIVKSNYQYFIIEEYMITKRPIELLSLITTLSRRIRKYDKYVYITFSCFDTY